MIIPFCILVFSRNRQKTGLVLFAGALVVLGVFCKRCWLLLTSFFEPNISGANGITLGTQAAQQSGANIWTLTGTYAPTWPEIVIVIAVFALGVLAFMVMCSKLLPKR